MLKPSGIVLKSPRLIQSITLIADNLVYALKSANRPHSTTVSHQPKMTVRLHGDKSPQGHRVHQQCHVPSGGNNWNETSKLKGILS